MAMLPYIVQTLNEGRFLIFNSLESFTLGFMRLIAFISVCLISACVPANSQGVSGQSAVTVSQVEGLASWYGPGFAGRSTANGEIFDPNQLTAAHKTLPFGTMVRVLNLDNGLSVVVRINDRGPFKPRRIIDLSKAAAAEIQMIGSGTANIRLEIISGPNGALRTAIDQSLEGYSVVATTHRLGELLVLSSPKASQPLMVRVVDTRLAAELGVDMLVSQALYDYLGDMISIVNP